MRKTKSKFRRTHALISALLAALVCLFSFLFASGCSSDSEAGDNVSWRTGLFTTLSLSLGADSGTVTATVRNDFTLGFSTVEVYVYLYSSEEYTGDVDSMQQEASNSTRDLNIFCELRASAETGGESKYWCAKMRYKSIEGVWNEISTSPALVDGRS